MTRPPFEIDPPAQPRIDATAVPSTAPTADSNLRPGRSHLVVVRCRAAAPADDAPEGSLLVSRFWHPRDRRWSDNYFESLEHALRLFVDESGWTLLQQQPLDRPLSHELIFEARRDDFTGPTTEEILRDVGLEPT